jgi:mycothiol S-conjugate amidase
VKKVYYATWSKARITSMHEKFLELGLESPYDEKWLNRPSQDDKITTKVDVSEYGSVRRDALRAHATQVDPTSRFWFGLPDDVLDTIYPLEDWVLASSEVETSIPEEDLFAGL